MIKEQAGSEISVADKRLQHYVGVDAHRRMHEKIKWMSLKDAVHGPKGEKAVVNVAEASRRAAEAINGSGRETIN